MTPSFKNKKVLIMGLGLHGGGVGAAKFFCGQKANVAVTDLKTKAQLAESVRKLKKYKIKYILGRHEEQDFISADLIIKNPDVPASSPYLEIAKKHNVPVETDVSLFLKLSKAFIIGVTGSKGKSTTSSLIFHFLKLKYKNAFLAGNIGISPLELLNKVRKNDKVVLELSSFELEDLRQSPNIAVITNIFPDHLNRYGTLEEYVDTKKIIFKYQSEKDNLILNRDDVIVRQFAAKAAAKVSYFSLEEKPAQISLEGFKLFGKNNLSNLLAAIAAAKILKVPDKLIERGIKSFKGVPSRQEFIKEVRGVKYFNDTTATIPEAVISAIDSLSERYPLAKIFLICGGVYKGVDYSAMAGKIRQKSAEIILLPGNASDKIKERLPGYGKIYQVSSMQEAVKTAHKLAKKGDLAILSPAASSFNMFKNEFDRGRQFTEAVKKLK